MTNCVGMSSDCAPGWAGPDQDGLKVRVRAWVHGVSEKKIEISFWNMRAGSDEVSFPVDVVLKAPPPHSVGCGECKVQIFFC